jgi:hypothetical protein
MSIGVVVLFGLVLTCSFGGASTLPFISKGDDVIRKIIKLVTIYFYRYISLYLREHDMIPEIF